MCKKRLLFILCILLMGVFSGCEVTGMVFDSILGVSEYYDDENDAVIRYKESEFYCRFSDTVDLKKYSEGDTEEDYLRVYETSHTYGNTILTGDFSFFSFDKRYIYINMDRSYYVFDRDSVPHNISDLKQYNLAKYSESEFFEAFSDAADFDWFGQKQLYVSGDAQ